MKIKQISIQINLIFNVVHLNGNKYTQYHTDLCINHDAATSIFSKRFLFKCTPLT